MASLFDDSDRQQRDKERHARAINLLEKLPVLDDWLKQSQAEYRDGDRRAFIMEFGGMPKAGKSTVIETVRHFFSHGPKIYPKHKFPRNWGIKAGYKVHTPAEGVSLRTPTFLKSDKVDFNVWAGAYAVQQLLEAGHDRYYDLAILDRGPWDAGCWLEYFRDAKNDTEELVAFFQLQRWMTQSDLHIVLVVDPNQAATRERETRLIPHGGPASDQDLMTKLRAIYERQFDRLIAEKARACEHVGRRSAIKIDTTGMDPKDVALKVIEAAFDVLQAKLGRLAPSPLPITIGDLNEIAFGLMGKVTATQKKALTPQLERLALRANQLRVDKQYVMREVSLLAPKEGKIILNRVDPELVIAELTKIIDRSAKK